MSGNGVIASIILPAFNAAAYIDEALDSAMRQTERQIEIVVIDDCSTDDTRERVRAAADRDGRVRLLQMAANGGPAAARNRGINAAHGAWIAPLDADDRIEPDRIRCLVAVAEQHGADIIADNLLLCREDGLEPPQRLIPAEILSAPRNLTAAEFVERNVGGGRSARTSFGFLTPMFRRAFLEANAIRYDERNRFGEDFMFYMRCLTHGANWWLTPEPTYIYNVRPGSLTEVQSPADLHRIRSMDRALLADPRIANDDRLRTALRRHAEAIDRCYYYRKFTDAVKQRRFPDAARVLLEGPSSIRHVVAESVVQAPTIAAKALRGGYRRGRARDG
ncbi:MAG: glycosyltransferase family 2 protein [Acetobacteraceae bacterium]|nr:glycosyltransferase family 2 protein [Acetobacteraceae bacterium]